VLEEVAVVEVAFAAEVEWDATSSEALRPVGAPSQGRNATKRMVAVGALLYSFDGMAHSCHLRYSQKEYHFRIAKKLPVLELE
jgi:hypothetical protein